MFGSLFENVKCQINFLLLKQFSKQALILISASLVCACIINSLLYHLNLVKMDISSNSRYFSVTSSARCPDTADILQLLWWFSEIFASGNIVNYSKSQNLRRTFMKTVLLCLCWERYWLTWEWQIMSKNLPYPQRV